MELNDLQRLFQIEYYDNDTTQYDIITWCLSLQRASVAPGSKTISPYCGC